MVSNTIQHIHCKKCDKDYLVGIGGKMITQRVHSGKMLSISNEELQAYPALPEKLACMNCGEICGVKGAKPFRRRSYEIRKNIHNMLCLDYDNYDERIEFNTTIKHLTKLEEAIKKLIRRHKDG